MNCERLKVVVRGAVQGVGFRPFVFRIASELGLKGWVSNSSQGVFIELEGPRAALNDFLTRLRKEKPPRAIVQSLESSFLDPIGYRRFEIRESEISGDKSALILPDIATCGDCLGEIFDSTNRRFRYPFTNCTNCGPRFSIIEALPYDRANTSMKNFIMCADCESEYHDPLDRRFHAQPNACPKCGPHLQLWDENGTKISECDNALQRAAAAIQAGKIVALKGIGGFQLIVDARNREAVVRLRERKHREEKPFALMYPSFDAIQTACEVSEIEKQMLLSPESPIVLVGYDRGGRHLDQLTDAVAPRNPILGVMLPYSPLHHLLMRELGFPVVATSGNLSDEPICIDERDALQRLDEVADLFLVHDRPIVRHVDDSITRVVCNRELILRRARGYAPLPITAGRLCQTPNQGVSEKGPTILALGAHLKNTVALKINDNIFVSQHIGDLETKQAYSAFQRSAQDLPRLYDARIDIVACDMHPDYLSTKFATQLGLPDKPIQHHFAHAVACMAENEIEPPALGVAWDGTGYGLDGTIWGGEFLLVKKGGSFERVAHLRQFRLPGGDTAIRQPRRSALGLLYEIFGNATWDLPQLVTRLPEKERSLLQQMLERQINAPLTSSVGRLFDAAAALAGLRQTSSFEGQAAMELEFTRQRDVADAYSFVVTATTPIVVNWEPAIRQLLDDVARRTGAGVVSAKFHNGLVEAAVAVSKKIATKKIVLSGGCFQNRYLAEHLVGRLREEKFQPYWHQRLPPNDGCIAFGQAAIAACKS
ncbi:MAG TPA: carbamoyltransferase HypF [Candidatus Udaeobacter sp.]|nr:carbamoyltransferase HypF [Candidatus Udaeobacter sp.]